VKQSNKSTFLAQFFKTDMFTNYLKTALRSMRRNTFTTAVNVAGLSIGVAVCLLLMLYVRYETSFDKHHQGYERSCRITTQLTWQGKTQSFETTPTILASVLQSSCSEVETAARLFNVSIFGPMPIVAGANRFNAPHFLYADPSVFSIFTFQFLHGDPNTALNNPNTIVLTRGAAERYFGTNDLASVMGKSLGVGTQGITCVVTGIVENPLETSHLTVECLASFSTLGKRATELQWSPFNYYTYIKLREGSSIQAFKENANGAIAKGFPTEGSAAAMKVQADVEPIADIYLHSPHRISSMPKGSQATVTVMLAVAIIILLLACVNYVNLSTARSERQAVNVGIRKTVGASYWSLVVQSFMETAVVVSFALVCGILLAELSLPLLVALTGKTIVATSVISSASLLLLAALWIATIILSALYPALYLASVKPVIVLRSARSYAGGASWLRRSLVVMQFASAIVMMIAAVFIKLQHNYLLNKSLGFQKESVVYVPVGDKLSQPLIGTLEREMLASGLVLDVAGSSGVPGKIKNGYSFRSNDMPTEKYHETTALFTDGRLAKVLNLELVAGEDFSLVAQQDSSYEFMLSTTALAQTGWTLEQAVGKEITMNGRTGRIKAVVKDFHFASLHEAIKPIVLCRARPEMEHVEYLLFKLPAGILRSQIEGVEAIWKRMNIRRSFDIQFLDEDLAMLYRSEQQAAHIMSGMAVLAVFVACLGLLALAVFTAEQRTKEIGIRKVLGASVASIITLLSTDFLKLVLVAIVLATPLAYWGMGKWLQDFAYRVELEWWVFAVSGGLALMIAFMTVAWQAWRAAHVNPVQSLRSE
jgi:putative ABC transport system permease protein